MDASYVPGEFRMSKGRGRSRSGNPRPSIRPRERTSSSAAVDKEERRNEQIPHWEFSRMAGSHELNLTAISYGNHHRVLSHQSFTIFSLLG